MITRAFRPVGGFNDSELSMIVIRQKDGYTHSYQRYIDGAERELSHVNREGHSKPVWSMEEMEQMVQAGGWEEIKPPKPPEKPEPTPAPPEPNPADATTGATDADMGAIATQ